ncbi:MAG TPA: hypothetical protein VFL99_06950 [Segeticoccus sp.]|uniref:helix-turn-helix transcriptional regulator n=1 Tax=Segeticoccus sp. TaxID=2706531 RepID=UPI002D7F3189|nr:hypothetical protein [Segeticoccus sp.]HET8600047.1 hypothetical protein [Segeticoccus sp.]
MSRQILTLEQVSERTGVPVNTLRFYRATGQRGPKTFKLGGRVVAFEEDVDAWVSACYDAEQTTPSSEAAGAVRASRS